MELLLPEADCLLLLPERQESYPLFWTLLDPDDARALFAALPERTCIFAAPRELNWNRDLTPWPAQGVHRNGGEFTGQGDAFLARLTEKMRPAADAACAELGYTVSALGIAGYSLGGMFSLYALTKCSCFSLCASASGSLWYDDFARYMRRTPVLRRASCALSLGRGETHARNRRMKSVASDTQAVVQALEYQGCPVRFFWNEGGHFSDPMGRLSRLVQALL